MKLSAQWHGHNLQRPSAWLVSAIREAEKQLQQDIQEEADRLSRMWEEQHWGSQPQHGWGQHRSGPYWGNY